MHIYILTKYNKIRYCTTYQWIWRISFPNSLNCYFGTCFGNLDSLWHFLSKLSKIINFMEMLYILFMSRTRVRVNPHSIVAWMSMSSLFKEGAKTHNTAHLASLWTKWFRVWIQLQSLKLQIPCLLRAKSSLKFRKL